VHYPCLGLTGFRLSRIILGGATFGELNGPSEVARLIDAAVDSGITTIDTGDAYAQGRSEELIGRAVSSRRDRLVICTKVGLRVGDGVEDHALTVRDEIDYAKRWSAGISPNDQGLSRGHIMAAVEASLRRLDTDYIDLYQLHYRDPCASAGETLLALEDLVRAGKVRYVGCSSLQPTQLQAYLDASADLARARPQSMQLAYNAVTRAAEDEVLPYCAGNQVSTLAIMTLAGGLLTGVYRPDVDPPPGSRLAARPMYRDRFWNDRTFKVVESLERLASESGRTVGQVALGWVLANGSITAAIVGAELPEQLEELAKVADDPLTEGELRQLQESL
jgi:1-deoxyxylulose-5-phosphate synthase